MTELTEAQAATYAEAKNRFADLAYKLQHRLPAIECANIFIGSGVAILRKAGGIELVEAYLNEILDDVRLDAAGYYDDPEVH